MRTCGIHAYTCSNACNHACMYACWHMHELNAHMHTFMFVRMMHGSITNVQLAAVRMQLAVHMQLTTRMQQL